MTELIQLAMAFLGSLGFAGIFNIKRDKLFSAAFGGFLSWGIYLFTGILTTSDALRYFVASFAFTIYAEIMARYKKTPATLFLVPAAIPLIPGGSLYTTMRYAVEGQREACTHQAVYTLILAGSIACGILCAMTVWTVVQGVLRKEFSDSNRSA